MPDFRILRSFAALPPAQDDVSDLDRRDRRVRRAPIYPALSLNARRIRLEKYFDGSPSLPHLPY